MKKENNIKTYVYSIINDLKKDAIKIKVSTRYIEFPSIAEGYLIFIVFDRMIGEFTCYKALNKIYNIEFDLIKKLH
jgi:hypothetical protein